jgi:hypothetical protein
MSMKDVGNAYCAELVDLSFQTINALSAQENMQMFPPSRRTAQYIATFCNFL